MFDRFWPSLLILVFSVRRDNNIIKLPALSANSLRDSKLDAPSTPSATAVDSEFSYPSPRAGKDIHDEESICPSYYGSDSVTTHTFIDDFRRISSEVPPISPSQRPMSFPSFFSKSSTR